MYAGTRLTWAADGLRAVDSAYQADHSLAFLDPGSQHVHDRPVVARELVLDDGVGVD
jgi:hypothetical protein